MTLHIVIGIIIGIWTMAILLAIFGDNLPHRPYNPKNYPEYHK